MRPIEFTARREVEQAGRAVACYRDREAGFLLASRGGSRDPGLVAKARACGSSSRWRVVVGRVNHERVGRSSPRRVPRDGCRARSRSARRRRATAHSPA